MVNMGFIPWMFGVIHKFRSQSDFLPEVVETGNQTLHSVTLRLNIAEHIWYNVNTQLNRINDKVLVVCNADVFYIIFFFNIF